MLSSQVAGSSPKNDPRGRVFRPDDSDSGNSKIGLSAVALCKLLISSALETERVDLNMQYPASEEPLKTHQISLRLAYLQNPARAVG